MLLYPSGESLTNKSTPPWATITLVLITLVLYFTFKPNLDKAREQRVAIAEANLNQAIELQFQEGTLPETFYLKTKSDLSIIGVPENRNIFNLGVRRAYIDMISEKQSLLEIAQQGPPQKLLLMFLPHELSILILGIVGWLIAAFLFEHRFDRLWMAFMFFASGASWLLVGSIAPQFVWPHPVFAWSNTIGVILVFTWLSAPRATITLRFRFWPLSDTGFKLPTLFIVLLYGGGVYLINTRFSVYGDLFSTTAQAMPLLEAVILWPLAWLTKLKSERLSPEEEINRDLSRAEGLFEEEKHEKGHEILKSLLYRDPNLAQIERIGDLAWRNQNNEIAKNCSQILLKDAMTQGDLHRQIEIINVITLRDLQPPGPPLRSIVQAALKKGLIKEVRNLLPYIDGHPELEPDDALNIYEALVIHSIKSVHPDKIFLMEIQEWLEKRHPESSALARLGSYFEKQRDREHAYAQPDAHQRVHRHVDVQLFGITSNYLDMLVGGKRQQVPWTAIIACYGCYLRGVTAFRAAVLIKFQRKIFACNLTSDSIMMKNATGHLLSFEKAWQILREQAPEDIPFTEWADFEEVNDPSRFQPLVQEFLDTA